MLNYNNGNKQLEFLDLLNIMSFCIGIANLNQNMTQNDKQELNNNLNEATGKLLTEIHAHLQEQDNKIDMILKKLEDMEYGS